MDRLRASRCTQFRACALNFAELCFCFENQLKKLELIRELNRAICRCFRGIKLRESSKALCGEKGVLRQLTRRQGF